MDGLYVLRLALNDFYFTEAKMEQQFGLNAGGWLFIIGAWGFIIVLTVFCFKRVLSTHNQKTE